MGKKSYDENYQRSFHNRLLKSKDYYLFRAKYADRTYWKYFENPNGKFLEFGCGIGQNIFLHKDKTIGIDISKFARKESGKRGIATKGSIKQNQQPGTC